MTMFDAALLSIIEEAGIGVLTLTEGLQQDEFFVSRLTRQETQRQLKAMSTALAAVPQATQTRLAEIDWSGWQMVTRQLESPNNDAQSTLWFAVRSLVPATLMWLRVYRANQPELFAYTPVAQNATVTP